MNRSAFSFLLVLLFAAATRAGELRLLNGTVYVGEVRLGEDRVMVSPPRAKPVKVDIANVLSATLQETGRAPSAIRLPAVDQNWKSQDVGPAGANGSCWSSGETKFLKGAGLGIAGAADSFYFAYKPLWGDGQILARLEALPAHLPAMKAGLMLREKFNERDSRMVFLYLTPSGDGALAVRSETGGESAVSPLPAGATTRWLRLSRLRDSVVAYASVDGQSWTQIGEPIGFHLGNQVFAGMAVCSGDANALASATFSQVTMRNDQRLPQTEMRPPVSLHRDRGVELRSGSALIGAQVESADDRFVHLRIEGKPVTIAASEVARLMFRSDAWDVAAKIPPTASGVLLARGDFIEGELQSLSAGRVRINSVLLGPKEFGIGSEAIAVVLHQVEPTPSSWEVRTNDGAVYVASNVKVDRDQLVVDDTIAGRVRVPGSRVISVESGLKRAEALSPLEPVVVRSEAILSRETDGEFQYLVGDVEPSAEMLPSIAPRLVAMVDGKDVYRSPELEFGGPVVHFSCALKGGKAIALRVENRAGLPCAVVVRRAMLVRGEGGNQ